MKRWLPFLISILCASAALAEPPVLTAEAHKHVSALVHEHLVKPMKRADSKRSRFSRGVSMPLERRVRVLASHTDVTGKHFVRFAIDARPAGSEGNDDWDRDQLIGCVYVSESQVFVQRGNQYLAADSMLDGDDEPHATACRPAPNA